MISNLVEFKHRGHIGLLVVASYDGLTLGMLMAGTLLENMSWRIVSLIIALPSIAGTYIFWFCVPGKEGYVMSNSQHKGVLLRASITNIKLWPIYLAYGLHAFELFLTRVWLPTILAFSMFRYFGHDKEYADAAILVSAMLAMGAIGVFFGGMLSDKIGRIKTDSILFAISGVCSLILGLAYEMYPIVLMVGFLTGFATASDSSIYSTLVVEMSDEESVSSNQSVQGIVGMLMGGSAPIIGGAFLDINGGDKLQTIFLVNAGAALVGVVLLRFAQRTSA